MTLFEQNAPVLTVTRRLACCGVTLRVAWIADADHPTTPAYVLRELDWQAQHHQCAADAPLPKETHELPV